MFSKISSNKFSLGYSISSFLITFGAITLYKSVTTNLFLIGANIFDLIIYTAFFSGFSFILALLTPLLGSISYKKKRGSRRSPYLIIGIVGMSLMTFLYYFSPLSFGSTDLFLNILYFYLKLFVGNFNLLKILNFYLKIFVGNFNLPKIIC